MKVGSRFSRAMLRVEELLIVHTVRSGLVNIIPILTIGAFALILQTFPVEAYQRFLETGAGSFLKDIFLLVYSATFGVLSVYMTVFISRAYMEAKADEEVPAAGAVVSSTLCFFILVGAYLPSFSMESLGPKSMFLAIITGLGAAALYRSLCRFFLRRQRLRLFSPGANREFNRMLSTLFPVAITAFFFALLNAVIIRVFRVDSFRVLLANFFNYLFSHGDNGFLRGFFFVLVSSVLWFFGIHGSDTLEGVMETYFTPGLAINQAAVAAGGEPTVILTKGFFDCFVLMGGCGATICLLISILLFSRNRARRGLGLTAAFPMIFNINEMMVFGLPIIYNPVMLIPFLAVPLVCYSAAYLAVALGLVPIIANEVAWTTPILLGGFRATGTLAGSLMQLVNVALGVLIYTPFVRALDRSAEESARRQYAQFLDFFRANEQELAGKKLLERGDIYGNIAKELCAELNHSLEKNILLAYQPQYRYDGSCLGAECLLRWKHPLHGMLYPPLVIKLAEEGGFLPELEEAVLTRALGDRPALLEKYGRDIKLSVNVTGTTVVTPRYQAFCRQLDARDPFRGKNLCIEITEQATLAFNEDTTEALQSLRDMGLMLAIDDFSMGQTSLHYLKDSMFDIIKLDGSLVKGLNTHQNCREIISSIVNLSSSLNLTVLAEYVETEEEKEILHQIGCDCYQGYLYSPGVFLE